MATAERERQAVDVIDLFARMTRIRAFEAKVRRLFKRGGLPGFVHLYVGQEAIAVGACAALGDSDRITSTHRGHGHVLAKGGDPKLMMAELFGRETGYCKGKGGSMHIADFALGILGANGIVGAGLPIATGSGLADAVLGRDNVTVCFFGDGAANQGVFLEALNLTAIWKLPVVFVCENNHYAQWTRTEDITAGSIADRGRPFGVPGFAVDGNDVLAMRDLAAEAVERARGGHGPTLIEADTYRHHGHSEGEETFTSAYRPKDEIEDWSQRDPIGRFETYLVDNGIASRQELDAIREREVALIEDAHQFAEASPLPPSGAAFEDLYAEIEDAA